MYFSWLCVCLGLSGWGRGLCRREGGFEEAFDVFLVILIGIDDEPWGLGVFAREEDIGAFVIVVFAEGDDGAVALDLFAEEGHFGGVVFGLAEFFFPFGDIGGGFGFLGAEEFAFFVAELMSEGALGHEGFEGFELEGCEGGLVGLCRFQRGGEGLCESLCGWDEHP